MAECDADEQKEWRSTATVGTAVRRGNRIVFKPLSRPNKFQLLALVDENTVTFTYGLRACSYTKDVDDPNPDPPPPPDEDEEEQEENR